MSRRREKEGSYGGRKEMKLIERKERRIWEWQKADVGSVVNGLKSRIIQSQSKTKLYIFIWITNPPLKTSQKQQFKWQIVSRAFCCRHQCVTHKNGCHFHSHLGVCQSHLSAVAHQPNACSCSSVSLERFQVGLVMTWLSKSCHQMPASKFS